MKRILLVDDELNSVEPIIMLLEEEGYEVKFLHTHEGMLNIIDELKPDLILLDICLGNIDGRYICNLLKSFERTNKIPIILISGLKDEEEVLKGNILGDGFLQKPFNLDELLKKVKTFLK